MPIEMIKAKGMMFCAVLLHVAAGCVNFSAKSGYSESIADQIVPNVTTLAEVLDLLGPPVSYTLKDGSIIYQYQREEKSSHNELIPLPATKELFEEVMKKDTTLLIIKMDSRSKIVSSVERKAVE